MDEECSGGRVDGVSGRPYLRDGYWRGAWEGPPITGSLSDPVPTPPLSPIAYLMFVLWGGDPLLRTQSL